jgi:hypothetical protein
MKKVHILSLNYHSIDNIFLKLSIVTMSLSNYQTNERIERVQYKL